MINEWIEHYENFESVKWFSLKNGLQINVSDSWDRKPKISELYISDNHFISFRTEFEEIKPTIHNIV